MPQPLAAARHVAGNMLLSRCWMADGNLLQRNDLPGAERGHLQCRVLGRVLLMRPLPSAGQRAELWHSFPAQKASATAFSCRNHR